MRFCDRVIDVFKGGILFEYGILKIWWFKLSNVDVLLIMKLFLILDFFYGVELLNFWDFFIYLLKFFWNLFMIFLYI